MIDYALLTYNRKNKKAFRAVCAEFCSDLKKMRILFANKNFGFTDWKKGLEKIKKHNDSGLYKSSFKRKRIQYFFFN